MSYRRTLILASMLAFTLSWYPSKAAAAPVLSAIANTTTVAANTSISISSGDITILPASTELDTADARLSSAGAFFTIGEISITVRYFSGATLLKSITLPTAPSIIDAEMIANQLFYSVAVPNVYPLNVSAVVGATSIRVRATAIVKNTTNASHPVDLALDILSE